MKKMRDGLEANKKDVTWISFENEGHGLQYIASQGRYVDALPKFLDRHLAPAVITAAPPAAGGRRQ